jgi:hypothetical protein
VFAAILDTCVLYPSLQRDFLLSLAVEGLYRPLWSEEILKELHRHEQRKLVKTGVESAVAGHKADHLIVQMRAHFNDALVTGWEGLEGTFGLPDPNDEDVVAAAVVGGAGAIVTENFKDIRSYLVPGHIEVLHAHEFAANTADVDPSRAVKALQATSVRRRCPTHTPQQLLSTLITRYGMDDVGEILTPVLSDLES